ncbi:protoporphyrinogen oxidase HemJ [Maritalea mediterranea]|uniref:Protoporphyrinogen IX oxidase n=1 Tax=Maritalea mediterranea TaxID=2909667 RepID=A0ABS9E667_9HYPH|nr:protoporphyrinogen oxidase HemJ [Maritalea mediterranea]MCF4096918.1 protoporphyrinogen oxidase HemJ [Maritalea mediterranea]
MLWVKSLHIISIIAWMAGMLYLPRLMVYHADVEKGSAQSETFKIMERRLLKAIMTPAMVASWIFGLWLVLGYQVASFTDGWFLVKLIGVLALSGMHGFLSKQVKAFAQDQNERSAKFFRMINEVPTLLMIIIVIMVVVKPF